MVIWQFSHDVIPVTKIFCFVDFLQYSSEDEVEEETIESTYANFKTKKKKV